MPATDRSLDAQRAALGIIHACSLHDGEATTAMLRAACHDHSPIDVMIHLSQLVLAIAALSESRFSRLLGDRDRLADALEACLAGQPLTAADVSGSADQVLSALTVAAAMA